MPTPDDESTPQAGSTPSSRNSPYSCPPDEDRPPHHGPRDERATRVDSIQPPPFTQTEPADSSRRSPTRDARTVSQQSSTAPRAGPDADVGASIPAPTLEEDTGKAEHIEDAGITPEPSSPAVGASPDLTSESDVRLAESMSAAEISSTAPSPLYLHFPDLNPDRQKTVYSTTSFLRSGSKFRGTQQSDRQVYDVQVEIKDVDVAESSLSGYLRIQGLTDDHPTLTTFFEGEIIGPRYLFKTDHSSWNSNEKTDMQHWARFPAWRPLAKLAKSPSFTLKNYQQREHLFMRWKEYFLVPDHRVKTITGASFEGFYYICFNQCSGSVSGIYFHAKSEKFQQLELKHVEDRGCMPAVEFR